VRAFHRKAAQDGSLLGHEAVEHLALSGAQKPWGGMNKGFGGTGEQSLLASEDTTLVLLCRLDVRPILRRVPGRGRHQNEERSDYSVWAGRQPPQLSPKRQVLLPQPLKKKGVRDSKSRTGRRQLSQKILTLQTNPQASNRRFGERGLSNRPDRRIVSLDLGAAESFLP
jgi:hypothetical protein